MSYRNDSELRYYGSDLNKFVNVECSKKMTAINVDLLMFKRSKKTIRLIESKHSYEDVPRTQFELLSLFAKLCKIVGYTFETFIVRGDPPYQNTIIVNLANAKQYHLFGPQKLKSWLEFELDLETL